MNAPDIVSIRLELDIIAASMAARDAARRMGFGAVDQARIATTASEISRDFLAHTQSGNLIIFLVQEADRCGLELVFEDQGDRIVALDELVASCGSMPVPGYRPSGARYLLDELEVENIAGASTRIVCRKWLR